ncbi:MULTISPECIES: aspartate/glutamate racemase family protein [unclassified Brenneria]|uniref:aspartate/glutamate racemase family protein n=1 Tax=unclassified Brenneria TaxID=2634434 RepID=UPI0018F0D899|nr:aspartate/glutamate racemase family protein [Brenneria sp. L3-3C-1]MBJ7220530.1 aspartate/glutamate racemase family protein [Brenneria sp. L3-3C-1]MEE3641774.1 aspartate/glutamate racemase family protein [Brenneria sp. L3_3C_1]
MTLGIIRVLTTQDQTLLEEHGRLLEQEYGLSSISRCISEQEHGIFDQRSEAIAVPKIIALGQSFQQAGCQAIFLSCAADPGLEQLRQAVTIPVISAGSACARIAASLKLPVAVIGIGGQAPAPFRRLLGETVAYARPDGVTQTTDLLTPEGKESAFACARQLYDNGAKAIAFSCTGLSTIALASRIRQEIGCVAIDAVSAAGMFAIEWLGSPASSSR